MKHNHEELIDKKFGKLKIKEIKINKNGVKNRYSALCLCDCGKETNVRIDSLKSGRTRSCGCLQPEGVAKRAKHGYWQHPLYMIFAYMKNRCYNENCDGYENYGGRGVKICNEWLSNPICFIEWALKNGWEKGKQIDKDIIPYKLGVPPLIYSPEMCSIVTQRENSAAPRWTTRLLTFRNECLPVKEWAIKLGIKKQTIESRLRKKWPIEKVLSVNNFSLSKND